MAIRLFIDGAAGTTGLEIRERLQGRGEFDLIVLDDAFQYRTLRAYFNIVLVDYNRPTYKDQLLPFGRLRDLPQRLHYADIIIVSLGVDTFKDDPISQFKLDSPDYLAMGARIADLGKPTLFVMEGGYAVEEIGINAVNVLQGFDSVS